MKTLDEQLTDKMLPRVLPVGWRQVGGNHFVRDDGLSVIVGAELIDGKRWWHVSLARPNRLPSWAELRLVKDLFVGRDKQAIQILPPESEYVNAHPYCLHMWQALDGDGLPDFRHEGVL